MSQSFVKLMEIGTRWRCDVTVTKKGINTLFWLKMVRMKLYHQIGQEIKVEISITTVHVHFLG